MRRAHRQGPQRRELSAPARERGWVVAAGLVVAAAAAARVHNAFAFPALHDFDGPGHALNAFALYRGRLPDPGSWSGFHPPLYYAAAAASWRALPESVPLHAALRLLAAAAGFGALALAWRTVRRYVGPADAAVTAALVAGAPVFAIATSMLGNETTCALLVTAALGRLAAAPAPGDPRFTRHSLVTMALASLAALAKSTGLLAVGVVALASAWRERRAPARAARTVAIVALPALLVLGPYYGGLIARSGSWLAPVTGGALSLDARAAMAAQPPGERRLSDYFSLPPATLLAPFHHAKGLERSVPGLLYASTWADGHASFLSPPLPRVTAAAALLAIGGLLPTALAAGGAWLAWRRRRALAGAAWLFVFAGALLAALLVQTWLLPFYSAVKASYLLPALLPCALLLALALDAAGPRLRVLLRGALLAYAAFAVAATWWGWWLPPPAPAPPRPAAAAPGTPEAAVEAYFRALGRDPIRTLPLLDDDAHHAHGLRLADTVVQEGPLAAAAEGPVERHQIAWLALQKRASFRTFAERLAVRTLAATHDGDRATVAVQVSTPGAPPFAQRFELVRAGPGKPWRIDAVTQDAVVAGNAPAAFVAWPNEAARAQLEQAAGARAPAPR